MIAVEKIARRNFTSGSLFDRAYGDVDSNVDSDALADLYESVDQTRLESVEELPVPTMTRSNSVMAAAPERS